MLRTLPLIAMSLLLATCEGNTRQRRLDRGENFVADPNYLYFKNTRQRHYRADDRGQAGNYFTHDDLYDSEASLIPVIYDNWIDDRAILHFHTRSENGPPQPSGPIRLLFTSSTGPSEISLPAQPDLATVKQLAHHLSTNRHIELILAQDTLPAFPGPTREAAREALTDYLRLLEN